MTIWDSNYDHNDSKTYLCLPCSIRHLPVSVLTAILPGGPGLAGARIQNVSILDFVGAKGDRGGGGNWNY